MSSYCGYFNLHVKKKDLTPIILSGLHDSYLLYEDQGVGPNQSPLLKPSFDLEMKEPQFMIEPLRLLQKIVSTELEERIEKKTGDVVLPYFSLHLTLWEKETGKWLRESTKGTHPLENFSRCHLTEFSMYRSCRVQMSEYDSSPGGKQPQMHRAIEIQQISMGLLRKTSVLNYENSTVKILSDESCITEAFNCFKQYYT